VNVHRFDAYSLQARVSPVLLAVAPLLSVCLFAPRIGTAYASIPVVFVVAAGLLAEEITRHLGKNLERRLAREWDGLPTVRQLRIRGAGSTHLRDRRRREVATLSNETLPDQGEELANPDEADQRYDDAVRRCLVILKARSPKSMLADENARYGFRRNLLAVKPITFVVMGLSIGLNIWLAIDARDAAGFWIVSAVIAIDALLWLTFVNKRWVRAQAETLAQRFFLSISSGS
jgi:hypothetical protein